MILGICKIFKDSISFLLKKRIPGTLPRNGTFFRVGETVPALPPLAQSSLFMKMNSMRLKMAMMLMNSPVACEMGSSKPFL